MNIIGERLTILSSTDPSKAGRTGTVLLDTARTLVLDSNGTVLRVEKAGSVFRVSGSNVVIAGADIAGRLEDRWGGRSR
ncbi:MAG: ribonuclease P protein subunit [Nitrososphaerales archaeon]|jgi:RNase P/RNase MRP subunit p29